MNRVVTSLLMIPELLGEGSARQAYVGPPPRAKSAWRDSCIMDRRRAMILQEETTDLGTPSGPMRTYLYRPVAPGRYPGLLLFSEIFQRTGPIKRVAALLAGHGFVVAVPEI